MAEISLKPVDGVGVLSDLPPENRSSLTGEKVGKRRFEK